MKTARYRRKVDEFTQSTPCHDAVPLTTIERWSTMAFFVVFLASYLLAALAGVDGIWRAGLAGAVGSVVMIRAMRWFVLARIESEVVLFTCSQLRTRPNGVVGRWDPAPSWSYVEGGINESLTIADVEYGVSRAFVSQAKTILTDSPRSEA